MLVTTIQPPADKIPKFYASVVSRYLFRTANVPRASYERNGFWVKENNGLIDVHVHGRDDEWTNLYREWVLSYVEEKFKIAKPRIARIHVNQHKIKANAKHGTTDPVISVKTSKANEYAQGVEIVDSNGKVVATVIYRPDNPLPCGARVWIETTRDRVRLV